MYAIASIRRNAITAGLECVADRECILPHVKYFLSIAQAKYILPQGCMAFCSGLAKKKKARKIFGPHAIFSWTSILGKQRSSRWVDRLSRSGGYYYFLISLYFFVDCKIL